MAAGVISPLLYLPFGSFHLKLFSSGVAGSSQLPALRCAPRGFGAGSGSLVVREQVPRLEPARFEGVHNARLLAPGAADHERTAVVALLNVEAWVVVVVGGAEGPEAVALLLDALDVLEDLIHGAHR